MRARKTKETWLLPTLLLVALSLQVTAQENAPTPPASTPPVPAPASDVVPPAANSEKSSEKEALPVEKSPTSAALEYLYNRKPQEGTAAKQAAEALERGKDRAIATDALGVKRFDDAVLRSRFEKYLAMPEIPAVQLDAYNRELSKVFALLQQRNAFEAWKQLSRLAEYRSIDAGVSQELANRIESIWNSDRTSQQLAQGNERLREGIRGTSRNADMLSDQVREKEIDQQRRLNQNRNKQQQPQSPQNGQNNGVQYYIPPSKQASSSPSLDSVIGKLQLTDAYLQTLESKAKIKLNELNAAQLVEQAKKNFSDYITTLAQTGRHGHVLVAADFYRRIFDTSEYPVTMAQQVNTSLEMAREMKDTVEVVKTKLNDNLVSAATEQLQTAFLINELDPSLQGLPRSYRGKVEKLWLALNRMQNLIEAREFTDLEALLKELKVTAPDFDATKAKAIVNAVKLEGQLRLGKAKLAAQQGDLKQAMEEFKAAAEVWPNNPDLKDKAMTFFDSQDIQSQSLREFDRLVSEGNYRGIFDKQLAFAPAMKDDLPRQKSLKEALEKVKVAEMAIEKANLLRANGDVFGAWETVEFAVTDLPGDMKLNSLRGELAGRGAEFVAAINRAKEAEGKKELGFSLTWYAIAQRHYPASQMANKAIERISQQILTPGAF